MYYFILFIVNAVICFLGFFVNEFAIIQISGDSGGFWGGGTIDTILFGGALFLIMSMIDITSNIKSIVIGIRMGVIGASNLSFR